MEAFNAEGLYKALLAILAICGAVATVGKAVETISKWRKPFQDKQEAIDENMVNCTKRFEKGERRMKAIEDDLEDFHEGQYHMCMCLKALLGHELHNGNSQEMIDAANDMDKWLVKRR